MKKNKKGLVAITFTTPTTPYLTGQVAGFLPKKAEKLTTGPDAVAELFKHPEGTEGLITVTKAELVGTAPVSDKSAEQIADLQAQLAKANAAKETAEKALANAPKVEEGKSATTRPQVK